MKTETLSPSALACLALLVTRHVTVASISEAMGRRGAEGSRATRSDLAALRRAGLAFVQGQCWNGKCGPQGAMVDAWTPTDTGRARAKEQAP
jgi:hypothetical protein